MNATFIFMHGLRVNLLIFIAFLSVFYCSGQEQRGIYLESNYQLAWGGATYSNTFSTPDGKLIVKSFYWAGRKGIDFPVNIFDSQTFRLYKQIKPVTAEREMKLSGDGKKLFLSSMTKKFEVWDLETGTMLRDIEMQSALFGCDVSFDGSRLLGEYTFFSKKLAMVDANSGQILFEAEKPAVASLGFCNHDSNFLVAYKKGLFLHESKTGQVVFTQIFPDGEALTASSLVIDKSGHYFLIRGYGKREGSFTYFGTVETGKLQIINKILDGGYGNLRKVIFSDDLLFMYGIDYSNSLRKYNLKDGFLVLQTEIVPEDTRTGMIFGKMNKELVDIASIKNGDYLLITDNYNVSYMYSARDDKVKAYLYSFGFDYAFITPDGRMDGTRGAIENLQWVKDEKKIPLSSTYDQMYTPNLMSQIFENKLENSPINLTDIVKHTPEIKINSPSAEYKTTDPSIPVTCELKENGEEIRLVRIYVNDKLVSDETRGMKVAGNTVTYNVTLIPGINSIKAVAISKNGYQSKAAEVMVTFSGTVSESRLFVMAIGVNKYKNAAYNLNYAVADASAMVEQIRNSAAGIFKSINIYNFQNESAKRDSILAGFNNIASQAQPQDAFILFYAGHGVMSEGSTEIPKDFYLVLYGVTQLYGRDQILKTQGISAAELRNLSQKIAAQKQVVFLDACQSGAAVETFAMRGTVEEKAILQLARSTGFYLIASTGSEQFATEFKELGHGVFTYALLQGLNCNTDGSEKDKKITIKRLEAFLNDEIPSLTQKYHGTIQYPKAWSMGMDFPIAVCK